MIGSPETARIPMIDAARFYGITLVYYGHVVERMMYLGNTTAASQYKFIYSFHMPLFFILAGFVAKDWAAEQSPSRFALTRLTSRVIPFVFFSLALAGLSLAHTPDFPPLPLDTAADYWNAFKSTLLNLPVFNIPTWFLMCLVSVEIIHFVAFRYLRLSDVRIFAAIGMFYVIGYVLNDHFNLTRLGDPFRWNWWFFNEAIVMYAFYLLGVFMRRHVRMMEISRPALAGGLALAALVFVLLTFDLNQGPFKLNIPAVVILASGHGHMVWFPITAVIGSVGVICLARLSAHVGWMTFLGRNALILFCLNGVFYHHLNGPFANWFVASMPQLGWSVTLVTLAATAASLLLAWPVLLVLDRWLPQLMGRPTIDGPLLPRLLK